MLFNEICFILSLTSWLANKTNGQPIIELTKRLFYVHTRSQSLLESVPLRAHSYKYCQFVFTSLLRTPYSLSSVRLSCVRPPFLLVIAGARLFLSLPIKSLTLWLLDNSIEFMTWILNIFNQEMSRGKLKSLFLFDTYTTEPNLRGFSKAKKLFYFNFCAHCTASCYYILNTSYEREVFYSAIKITYYMHFQPQSS